MQSEVAVTDPEDTSTRPSTSVEASTFVQPTTTSNLRLASTAVHEQDPSPRPGKRARLNLQPMTAAAAIEAHRASKDKSPSAKQITPNPAAAALNALKGSMSLVSQAQGSGSNTSQAELEPATTMSEPLAVVAENIQQPSTNMAVEVPAQTSPISVSSLATLESTTATAPVLSSNVASPAALEEPAQDRGDGQTNTESTSPDGGPKALSYPGPLLQPLLNDARRGMSLPGSGLGHGSRSPSNKKHRCPYCSTEFTRHHNLKSHLLTHSQEKPYVCSTCQSRFRRLHDLKRHSKLHTGERPHICEKCGRRFARGDALARHNKGPGGCAGRRESMGSLGGDDDYDGGNDDSMEGLVYNEPDVIDEDEGAEARPRMPRVPSIKHHEATQDDSLAQGSAPGVFAGRQPSTYPPIQGRPPGGLASGAFPPRQMAGISGSSAAGMSQSSAEAYPTSTSSSLQPPGQGSTVFPQSAMTESPKPLSPGSAQVRQAGHSESSLYHKRSPSLSTQLQQQQFGRASTRRSPPAGSMGMVGPAPHLPPPPGLNPPDSRFTLPSQGGPTHPPTQPSGPPTHMSGSGPLSSHNNSHSSHGHSGQGSGENAAPLFGQSNERLWAYVKSLEQRINGLQDEVISLRSQLALIGQTQPR